MNFDTKHLEEFQKRGISAQKVEEQIAAFVNGFPYLSITRAAVVGDGILRLSAEQVEEYSQKTNSLMLADEVKLVKFVPASGAATRMFKEYFEYEGGAEMSPAVKKAVENIEKFAFYSDLQELGIDFSDSKAVVSAIIGEGLEYGAKPKALLKFHSYKTGGRTACEEHLVEGALYGVSGNGNVYIHFTLSPEHRAGFEELISKVKEAKEKRYGITYQISYSEQMKSTDTIAVDMENRPFLKEDGSVLFRPAGHGALLENLNNIDAEVILIKTIDNVVPDSHKNDTVSYKKALTSLGLDLQQQIFTYINALERDSADLTQVKEFVERSFGYRFASDKEVTKELLISVLNRPVRVCGMVKNEGEPGGGPFWVKSADGSESVQIAESSQIAPEQKNLMQEATHFNPVDIICLPKCYNGTKFDLREYVDPTTGFNSEKSYAGRALKAQELPGLWNGGMANWNTLFVEVPITTFAPVKVLTDLLRGEHQ